MVVVVFALVQNVLVTRQYRENVLRYMVETGAEMIREIGTGQNTASLERRLLSIANSNGCTVQLFF